MAGDAEALPVLLDVEPTVHEGNAVIEFGRLSGPALFEAGSAEGMLSEVAETSGLSPSTAVPRGRLPACHGGDEGKGTPTPLDGEHSARAG